MVGQMWIKGNVAGYVSCKKQLLLFELIWNYCGLNNVKLWMDIYEFIMPSVDQ